MWDNASGNLLFGGTAVKRGELLEPIRLFLEPTALCGSNVLPDVRNQWCKQAKNEVVVDHW